MCMSDPVCARTPILPHSIPVPMFPSSTLHLPSFTTPPDPCPNALPHMLSLSRTPMCMCATSTPTYPCNPMHPLMRGRRSRHPSAQCRASATSVTRNCALTSRGRAQPPARNGPLRTARRPSRTHQSGLRNSVTEVHVRTAVPVRAPPRIAVVVLAGQKRNLPTTVRDP